MKKRLLVASLAISMLAVLAAPASAGNWWGGYKWDTTTTTMIAVEDNVDDSWDGLLDDVLIDWNESVLTLVKTVPDRSSSCGNPLGAVGTIGLIEVCNKAYGQNGWLGIARIWLLNGTEITSAVAAVNDSYFNTAPYKDPIAKRHVLCQEIGHTISLDHQNSPRKRSCMNDRWGLLDDRFQSPNDHDFDQLAEIYGISGGDSGGGGGGGPCKSPNHPSCKSGLTTFEIEDLGNGRAVLTWITWVPGQGPTG